MSDFLAFAQLGFRHIADVAALDHVLFLLALAAVYRLADWRDALWVISAFTIGHSITLALSVADALPVDQRLVEFLGGDEAYGFRRRGANRDELWALETLRFTRSEEPARGDILRRFRSLIREAHPDHGGETMVAGDRITDLAAAKRILLAG